MKFKKFFIAVIAVMMALMMTGCASNVASKSDGRYASEDSYAVSYDGAFVTSESAYEYGEVNLGFDEDKAVMGETETVTAPQFENAKLIYEAYMVLETTKFDDAYAYLSELVQKYGGYMEYSSVENYSTYRYGEYTVRIPSENYQDFVSSMKGVEKVRSFSESVTNVSNEYYDVEARLNSAKTKLESLNALMAKAENMEDIIVIQNSINDVQYEIDSLSGTLRNFDQLVGFSTVNVTIREVAEIKETEEPVIGFGQQIAQAFKLGCSGAVDGLKNLALFIVREWVMMAVLLIIVIVIIVCIKRSQKKKKARLAAQQAAMMAARQQNQQSPQV